MSGNCTYAFLCSAGVLRIRAPWADTRIEWRTSPQAREKLRRPRSRWQECWPEFRILRPEANADGSAERTDIGPVLPYEASPGSVAAQKSVAFAAFRDEIPDDIAVTVAPFRSHQWALLKLLHEETTFRDLARTNAVLAHCLANNGEFRGTDARIGEQLAIRHVHSKQREILEWLGFPGSPAIVRLMKKILPTAVTPFAMRRLRTAAQRDKRAMKLLAHQRRIGACQRAVKVHQ